MRMRVTVVSLCLFVTTLELAYNVHATKLIELTVGSLLYSKGFQLVAFAKTLSFPNYSLFLVSHCQMGGHLQLSVLGHCNLSPVHAPRSTGSGRAVIIHYSL